MTAAFRIRTRRPVEPYIPGLGWQVTGRHRDHKGLQATSILPATGEADARARYARLRPEYEILSVSPPCH